MDVNSEVLLSRKRKELSSRTEEVRECVLKMVEAAKILIAGNIEKLVKHWYCKQVKDNGDELSSSHWRETVKEFSKTAIEYGCCHR